MSMSSKYDVQSSEESYSQFVDSNTAILDTPEGLALTGGWIYDIDESLSVYNQVKELEQADCNLEGGCCYDLTGALIPCGPYEDILFAYCPPNSLITAGQCIDMNLMSVEHYYKNYYRHINEILADFFDTSPPSENSLIGGNIPYLWGQVQMFERFFL